METHFIILTAAGAYGKHLTLSCSAGATSFGYHFCNNSGESGGHCPVAGDDAFQYPPRGPDRPGPYFRDGPGGGVTKVSHSVRTRPGSRQCRPGGSGKSLVPGRGQLLRETRQKDILVTGIRQKARGRSPHCKKAFIPPTSAMFWRTTVEVGARPAGIPTGPR